MLIHPKIWGPHIWFNLHLIAATYPENPSNFEKNIVKLFVFLSADLLPCKKCKKHMNDALVNGYKSKNIDKFDVSFSPFDSGVLKNKNNLFEWMYNFHNYVTRYKKTDTVRKYPKLSTIKKYYGI